MYKNNNNSNKKINYNNSLFLNKNIDECKTNDLLENSNSLIVSEKDETSKTSLNFYYPIKNKKLVYKSKIKPNYSLHIDLTGLSTSQITDSEFKREMENKLKEREIEEKIKNFKLNGGLYKNAFNHQKLKLLNNDFLNAISLNEKNKNDKNDNYKNDKNDKNDNYKNDKNDINNNNNNNNNNNINNVETDNEEKKRKKNDEKLIK